MSNDLSMSLHFPIIPMRTCIKCHVSQDIKNFTSSGTPLTRVCDTCVSNWRTEQRAKGNSGCTHFKERKMVLLDNLLEEHFKERKKSLGKNNP